MNAISRYFAFAALSSMVIVGLETFDVYAQQERQRPAAAVTEGVVTAIDAKSVTIKTAAGASKTIPLSEMTRVNRSVKMSASDLKAGMNVRMIPENAGGKRILNLAIMPERRDGQRAQRPGDGAAARRERPQGQGADGQRGGRSGRGGRGGTMAKVVSTAPLKLESGQGQAREIPAGTIVNVTKTEVIQIADVKNGAKVTLQEMETPRGKFVLITLND